MSLSAEFLSYFSEVEDPRVPDRNLRHKLEDMFAIAILAAICGADNWVEISILLKARRSGYGGFWNCRTVFLRTIRLAVCLRCWMRMRSSAASANGHILCLC